MRDIVFTKKLPVKASYDIIVCGGGVAGCAAAVTAAKRGKSVLLLEKSNILGGLATLGLINLFVPMCNGHGRQIIFGLAEKWTRDSAKYGYDTIPKEWKNGEPKEPTSVRYMQRYSPYIFALQLTEEVRASGADVLFDCIASEPIMEGNSVKGIVTQSKSGLEYYECKTVIDATGDADVLRQCGVPTVLGHNYFTYSGKLITLDSCKKAAESGNIRDAFGSICGGGINLYGDGQPNDVPMWSGTTVEDVTDYIVRNHAVMLENLKSTDRNTREIAMLPLMPQFRTTCRLDGDYALTSDDTYKHFEDSVCAINDFDNRSHLYEVPLRTLCRRDYPNIVTAGRSASGIGYAWDLLRVIPPAIITGQAAAEAASLAIEEGVGIAEVTIKTLQARIESDNIMVHFPESYVPEGRPVHYHKVSETGHF